MWASSVLCLGLPCPLLPCVPFLLAFPPSYSGKICHLPILASVPSESPEVTLSILVRFQTPFSVLRFRSLLTFSLRLCWCSQRAPNRLRIFLFYICNGSLAPVRTVLFPCSRTNVRVRLPKDSGLFSKLLPSVWVHRPYTPVVLYPPGIATV